MNYFKLWLREFIVDTVKKDLQQRFDGWDELHQRVYSLEETIHNLYTHKKATRVILETVKPFMAYGYKENTKKVQTIDLRRHEKKQNKDSKK